MGPRPHTNRAPDGETGCEKITPAHRHLGQGIPSKQFLHVSFARVRHRSYPWFSEDPIQKRESLPDKANDEAVRWLGRWPDGQGTIGNLHTREQEALESLQEELHWVPSKETLTKTRVFRSCCDQL